VAPGAIVALASAPLRGHDPSSRLELDITPEACMADATVRGRFVWHDLLTPNAAGAHEFYGKAIGWTPAPWKQDPTYLMFAGPGGPIGGSVERATAPQWLPYIGTTDVDAAVSL